jgi:hypothetical protein
MLPAIAAKVAAVAPAATVTEVRGNCAGLPSARNEPRDANAPITFDDSRPVLRKCPRCGQQHSAREMRRFKG